VPAYSASKAGIGALVKALANEWAALGVNVNGIAPGYVATDNTQALRDDQDRNASILARIPAGRWADAADIAGAAVFLASDAAGYIHGEIITAGIRSAFTIATSRLVARITGHPKTFMISLSDSFLTPCGQRSRWQ
jgi:NAD(P)-dependent dehydrogenase (short-subunit alcohol dehydrogenase family)